MIIKLSPQRRDETLEVVRQGNKLTLNGELFDFSSMPEGSTLPVSAMPGFWFAGPVDMIDGELTLTLLFPNPYNYSQAQAFPVPLVDVPDGPVKFPDPLTPEETKIKVPTMFVAEVTDQE